MGSGDPGLSRRNGRHHESAAALWARHAGRARLRRRAVRALADQHLHRRPARHRAHRARGLRRGDRRAELPRLRGTDPRPHAAPRRPGHRRQSQRSQSRGRATGDRAGGRLALVSPALQSGPQPDRTVFRETENHRPRRTLPEHRDPLAVTRRVSSAVQPRRMPELFPPCRVLGRPTIMKTALKAVR